MFKEMKEMSDVEIRRCMSMLLEGSVIADIRIDSIQNAIDVSFTVMGVAENEVYTVSLLPDGIDVEKLPEYVKLRVNGVYLYEQFMIAKGYSEYWKDNIFCDF